MNKLPKINQPLFESEIPSSGNKIKFRPFTVKEEKILLIAQESKDLDQILLAIKQIVNNCIENIDVDKLAIFDLEYLLLQIRAKSVNNIFEFNIKDPETSETVNLKVDIKDIKVKKDQNHTNRIKINEDMYLIMKYPSLDVIKLHLTEKNNSEVIFKTITSCIDKIVDDDSIFLANDFTETELVEFIDQLTPSVVKDIEIFFDSIPRLKVEAKYTNKNGNEKTFIMEGMETFFI